jgi:hypothetical protein
MEDVTHSIRPGVNIYYALNQLNDVFFFSLSFWSYLSPFTQLHRLLSLLLFIIPHQTFFFWTRPYFSFLPCTILLLTSKQKTFKSCLCLDECTNRAPSNRKSLKHWKRKKNSGLLKRNILPFWKEIRNNPCLEYFFNLIFLNWFKLLFFFS